MGVVFGMGSIGSVARARSLACIVCRMSARTSTRVALCVSKTCLRIVWGGTCSLIAATARIESRSPNAHSSTIATRLLASTAVGTPTAPVRRLVWGRGWDRLAASCQLRRVSRSWNQSCSVSERWLELDLGQGQGQGRRYGQGQGWGQGQGRGQGQGWGWGQG